MHELAVCQALLDQVHALARQENATAVTAITIEVGPLSGVEPDLLSRAYGLARINSLAHDAELIVNTSPVRVDCEACGTETVASTNNLVCGNCGNWRTRLVAGDELTLVRVEMSTQGALH